MIQSAGSPVEQQVPRIAIVRQKYRVDGGAERFVANLLRVFDQHQFDVTLVTRDWGEARDLNVIRCNPPALGRIVRDWGFSVAAGRALRRQSFDLVQSHERLVCRDAYDVYRAGDGVHREWLRQRERIQPWYARLATRWHPYHWYTRHAEKKLFESPRLKAVICNSQMVRHEILQHFSIAPEKLRVIYSGVDTERFHPQVVRDRDAVRQMYGVPAAAPAFLMVGSGFVRKGVAVALRALADVPSAHLMVVGKDKQMGRFLNLANQLVLANRVHFAGVQDDVRPFYGAADALLLPTLYDPLPNVLLEAMACGLPVITSTKCGGAELVRNAACGDVCDALDAAAVSQAMTRLCDVAVAKTLGRAARRAIEPFSLSAMQRQLSEFYLELLRRPDSGGTSWARPALCQFLIPGLSDLGASPRCFRYRRLAPRRSKFKALVVHFAGSHVILEIVGATSRAAPGYRAISTPHENLTDAQQTFNQCVLAQLEPHHSRTAGLRHQRRRAV